MHDQRESRSSVRADSDGSGRALPLSERLVSRVTPLTAVAAVLVVLQAVVRGWVVSGSYYFQDDFAHLDLARRSGLSSEYLVRDYGGHLEMGQYALIWLVSHVVDGSFAPAAVSVVVLQAVASVLLLVLLRTLFGDSPLILLPWTAYLFTPLALGWSSWWSAALQTLPMQIATITVLLASNKAHAQRSRWWALIAVVAFVGGLLMWQKAALVLPIAVVVQLLVVSHPSPWKHRLLSLRRAAGMWLALTAVLAAYVVFYLSTVDDGLQLGADEPFDVRPLLDQSLFRTFVPGLFGGPWHSAGAESTIYPYTQTFPAVVCLFAFAVLVVLSFAVTGFRAYEGWLLLAGYLTADLALLGLGRGDWIGILVRDPRYIADSLPIMAIAVCAAFRGLVQEGGARRPASWLRRRSTLPAVGRGVVVLIASCLVTTVRMAPVVQHEYAENYTLGVARQMEAEPARSVVNTAPPYEVSARADLAGVMNAIGADVDFDRPATQMFLFDGLAQLRRTDLFPGSAVESGPVEGCGWPVGTEQDQLWEVESDYTARRILRVGYFAREAAELEITVAGRTQSLGLQEGVGQAFFVIGPEAGSIMAQVEGTDGICVTDLGAGAAWVAEDAGVPVE